jgi:hypothetical protein
MLYPLPIAVFGWRFADHRADESRCLSDITEHVRTKGILEFARFATDFFPCSEAKNFIQFMRKERKSDIKRMIAFTALPILVLCTTRESSPLFHRMMSIVAFETVSDCFS